MSKACLGVLLHFGNDSKEDHDFKNKHDHNHKSLIIFSRTSTWTPKIIGGAQASY